MSLTPSLSASSPRSRFAPYAEIGNFLVVRVWVESVFSHSHLFFICNFPLLSCLPRCLMRPCWLAF